MDTIGTYYCDCETLNFTQPDALTIKIEDTRIFGIRILISDNVIIGWSHYFKIRIDCLLWSQLNTKKVRIVIDEKIRRKGFGCLCFLCIEDIVSDKSIRLVKSI